MVATGGAAAFGGDGAPQDWAWDATWQCLADSRDSAGFAELPRLAAPDPYSGGVHQPQMVGLVLRWRRYRPDAGAQS